MRRSVRGHKGLNDVSNLERTPKINKRSQPYGAAIPTDPLNNKIDSRSRLGRRARVIFINSYF